MFEIVLCVLSVRQIADLLCIPFPSVPFFQTLPPVLPLLQPILVLTQTECQESAAEVAEGDSITLLSSLVFSVLRPSGETATTTRMARRLTGTIFPMERVSIRTAPVRLRWEDHVQVI